MELDSTYIRRGRYVAGGQTEVNNNALEWWERGVLETLDTDVRFVVDSRSEGRPDLIAQAMLGDSKLWWLLLQYNSVLDPFAEVSIGRVLKIPDASRVQLMLNGKTGGYPSQREVPLTNITPIV